MPVRVRVGGSTLVTAATGTVYLKLSEWAAAASDFESALGISADVPAHHYAFAVALEHIGRREEAFAPASRFHGSCIFSPFFAPCFIQLLEPS